MSYLGTLLNSFAACETAVGKLLELSLGRKRIERLTERIGGECVHVRNAEVVHFEQLALEEKLAGPAGVLAPEAATVMLDGGRLQKRSKNANSKTHWFEYKAGFCGELGERVDGEQAGENATDPLPDVPQFLLNLEQVETLTREIGHKAAGVPEPNADVVDDEARCVPDAGINLEDITSLEQLEERVAEAEQAEEQSQKQQPLSPEVTCRDVVASGENSDAFGVQLAARAWSLGLFQATRKAVVGDGGNWLWTTWETQFKPFGFLAVLDIIHAATYVYASAMAGRTIQEGGPVYRRWITWVWQGEVAKVIAELAQRQAELGLPTDEDGETSPRKIVHRALTYLQNQHQKMDYPRYRKLGLPITSSLMESTVKQINQRIKGTEKFWSDAGSKAVLQLKANTLCDSDPQAKFWAARESQANGLSSRCKQKTTAI